MRAQLPLTVAAVVLGLLVLLVPSATARLVLLALLALALVVAVLVRG